MNSSSNLIVEGITVEFPYTLYKPQEEYIRNLVKALRYGHNALLESPTGTGKTLCLLCGALTWQYNVCRGLLPHPAQLRKDTILSPTSDFQSNNKGGDSSWNDLENINLDCSHDTSQSMETLIESSLYGQISSEINPDNVSKINTYVEATPPTIYIASRTHSQLAQIIGELKKTCYVSNNLEKESLSKNKNISENTTNNVNNKCDEVSKQQYPNKFSLKVVTLASRDNYCIDHNISNLKGHSLIAACQQKIKNKMCPYELNLYKCKSDIFETPYDIEDFRSFAKKRSFCPYFGTKENVSKCNLVLLPYEYILNPWMRKLFKLVLKNSVIIFDEGHNLEKVCEETGSFDVNLSDLNACNNVILDLVNSTTMINDTNWVTNAQEFFIQPIEELIEYIDNTELLCPTADYGFNHLILPGDHILEIFQRCGFSNTKVHLYEDIISKCSEWIYSKTALVNDHFDIINNEINQKLTHAFNRIKALESLVSFISTSYSISPPMLKWYRLFIHEDATKLNFESTLYGLETNSRFKPCHSIKTLSFWCFNPGIVLQELVHKEKIHSLIITSGTLSPLQSYSAVLGGFGSIKYDILLDNDHVIPSDQLLVKTISNYGKQFLPLRFVYQVGSIGCAQSAKIKSEQK